MTRRRRRTGDPFALATRPTRRVIPAGTPGTCTKCLTDYPAGALIIHGRHGWQHAVCDENED